MYITIVEGNTLSSDHYVVKLPVLFNVYAYTHKLLSLYSQLNIVEQRRSTTMALQEGGGWPLGLQPLSNMRVRNLSSYGSLSFSTLITGSPTSFPSSSSISSTDIDTESSRSTFADGGTTLGSLIGIRTNIMEFSSRSIRSRTSHNLSNYNKAVRTLISWFSLCPRLRAQFNNSEKNIIAGTADHYQQSLGYFLEIERRATNNNHLLHRSTTVDDQVSVTYEMHGLANQNSNSSNNTLFSADGSAVAPPPTIVDHSSSSSDCVRNLFALSMFSCIGGQ